MRSFPAPFREAFDTADDDVRTEPSYVAPEGGDSAIRRHQEGEDVEAAEALVFNELGVGAGRGADGGERRRRIPAEAIDQRRPVRAEGAVKSEQAVLAAGGANALRPPDVDDAIPRDALAGEVGFADLFACETFDGVAPKLGDRELGALSALCRGGV